ncbi:MAG: RNA polymerase sigma factor [Chloroflexota bacterium]|nr:RNA polymerase sigma factor [Chloroflexota bacterium]
MRAELSAESYAGTVADEALLVRAAQEDATSFAPLYHHYYPRVYRYLRARCGTDEDAADLTQAVFLRALAALPNYRERGLPFAAWLFRIASNLATDAQRKQRPTVDIDILPEEFYATGGNPPEQAAIDSERLDRLRAVVATLDASKRELLELRFAGGLTSAEIAAVVGKREGTVKRQLSRIIQGVREQYGEA